MIRKISVVLAIGTIANFANAGCIQDMASSIQLNVGYCTSSIPTCDTDPYGLAGTWATYTTLVGPYGPNTIGYEGKCFSQQCTTGIVTYGGFGSNFSCGVNEVVPVPGPVEAIYERPNYSCGSIVQIENQILGEQVPLTGVGFTMNYFTNWIQGHSRDYKIRIPLSGDSIDSSISSFDISIKQNGVVVASTSILNNQANLSYEYYWNGLDGSGNSTIGSQSFEVTSTTHMATMSLPLSQNIYIGSFRAKQLGLGGWVPSVYNFYDAGKKVLYKGDGSTRSVEGTPWNTSGFVIPEEDASLVYYFDSTGRQIYTKSGLLGAILFTFNYDTQGRLTSIVEPFGKTTTFNRNLNGDFISVTSPKGQVTTVILDNNGFIASFTNPNSDSYSMTYYGTQGLLNTFQKPQGQVSTFTYDANGNLDRDAHSGGYFFDVVKNLNPYGQNIDYSKVSKSGKVTSYIGSYTESNSNVTITSPSTLQQNISFYKSGGSINENESRDGISLSRTKSLDVRFGSLANFLSNFWIGYGNVGFSVDRTQTITLNDPNDPFSIATYSVNSQKGNLNITTTYNPSTKVFTTTTGVGRSSETTIDTYERVTSLKQGNLYSTDFTYTNENITKIKQNTREINIAYNSTTGFLSSITNPLNQVTGFTYNNAGRVTAKTLPDLRVIGYSYDANGNLTGITPPSRPVHSFGINASELPSSYAPPTLSGVSVVNTTYSYNDDKQLTQVLKPTGNAIDFSYNATTGVLESLTAPAGIYTYTMSTTNGLPSSIVSPNSGPITNINYSGVLPTQVTTYTSGWTQISDYTANLSSNGTVGSDVVTGASATSTINYTYDNDEVLKTAGDIVLNYNTPNGLLTSLTMGTGSTTGFTDTYTYNNYGEVETYTAKRGSTTLYTLSFGRDALGRINSKTEFMNAATNAYVYTFDSTGRLTQTDKNAVTVASYGYDSNSNRNSGTIGSQATTATYNDQDWMTAYNTLTFTYNANGDLQSRTNTTTSTTTQYVYDVFGNLTQVTLPSGTVIAYEIDGLNRRIGKKVNGVLQKRWVYRDQTRIAAELNASGGIAKRFIYGSKGNVPDYMIVGTTKYRIISDHLGSVRLVVKQSDGTVVQRMNHDEFGRVTEDTTPGYLPFGFAGGLYDHQTGLVRFGARDYDSETGRWTSKDPILFDGEDENLYGYVENDPTNWIDIIGLNKIKPGQVLNNDGLSGGGVSTIGSGSIGGGVSGGRCPISGYTRHGINSAISRADGGSMSPRAILNTVTRPASVTPNPGGGTIYSGPNGQVILNPSGRVITVIPSGSGSFRGNGGTP